MTGAPRVHCGPRLPNDCRTPSPRLGALLYAKLGMAGSLAAAILASDERLQGMPWGGALLLGGFLGVVLAHEIRRARRARRTRRAQQVAKERDAPWRLDNAWNPTGATVRGGGRRRRLRSLDWLPPCLTLLGALIVVALRDVLGPHGWVWLCVPGTVFVLWLVWIALRAALIGTARLRFRAFPFFTGETAEMTFGMDDGSATFEAARFILRRYADEPGPAFSTRCRVTCEVEFVPQPGILPGPGNEIVLRFDIPADAGGTSLSAVWPSYWELEIAGETTHGPYRVMVLVPVYERPRSGR